MTDPDEALIGLRFTLSHPVTTALMPASERAFAGLRPRSFLVPK